MTEFRWGLFGGLMLGLIGRYIVTPIIVHVVMHESADLLTGVLAVVLSIPALWLLCRYGAPPRIRP